MFCCLFDVYLAFAIFLCLVVVVFDLFVLF